MKKIIFVALLGFMLSANAKAGGIPVPYCSKCEYITIVADLPDSSEFYSEEYKGYMDIGYKYSQFWLVWLPIWNSDGEYVLTIKGQDVYFDITSAKLKRLAKTYNIDLSDNPIPLWDKIGGKAVIGLIIVFAILYYFFKDKVKSKKEEEEEDDDDGDDEVEEDDDILDDGEEEKKK
jgi:hypothetical protein